MDLREPTARETAIFDALVEVARPVILSAFNPDSCIASTRLGMDVLAYFGIQTREIPLLLAVFNADAVALLQQGKTMDEVKAETLRYSPEDEGGPWTMAVGAPTGRAPGWAGHLVIGHPATGAVIDLSADQAARPHKGLELTPYWLRIPDPAWWNDPTEVHSTISGEGVAVLFDRRCPDPTGYLRSGNWKRRTPTGGPGLYRDLTGQIIRAVRDRTGL